MMSHPLYLLIIEEKTVPPQFASTPLAMALQHLIFKTKRVRHNVAPFEKLELVDGFEPPSYCLQVNCTTNCATPAYCIMSVPNVIRFVKNDTSNKYREKLRCF